MDHERSSCGPATVNSVIIILINISLHEYYSYYYYYNNYIIIFIANDRFIDFSLP